MGIHQKLKNNTLIIAEAGVNHNGDFNTAINLIDEASKAGADIIKFQTFRTEKLTSRNAQIANYQRKNDKKVENSQFDLLKNLEIPKDWYPKLINRCKKSGIKFLSTGFDEESLILLDKLNIPFFKIPSGEITNKPYLELISKFKKEIVLSTGLSTFSEVKKAVSILTSNGIKKDKITILHCNTAYPTPYINVNLNSMLFLRDQLNMKVGFSDHSIGIEVPIAAVALGATIIEKHFTLDVEQEGPDHKSSLSPFDFKTMVEKIRNIEVSLGHYKKERTKSEIENLNSVRKSIHINCSLMKGEVLKESHLIMLRPGNGISPMEIHKVVGKKTLTNLNKNQILKFDYLA